MNDAFNVLISDIFLPILYIAVISFVLTLASLQLKKAWEMRSKKAIWFYTWFILMGVYYLLRLVILSPYGVATLT
ncbi:MAG: hypothetical protein ACOYK9_05240 [Chlamydiia bacterium]